MSLSTKQAAGSAGSTGIKVTDGVYVTKKIIKGVKDLSGTEHKHIGKTFDLYLVLKFDDDRTEEFFGNLKKDDRGIVEGWGGAFVIGQIFENVGVTAELDSQFKFKKADMKQLIDKEIGILSYTSGTYEKDGQTKQSYSTWNMTFPAELSDDELASMALEAWEKSRANGYPKNYTFPMNSNKPAPTGGGNPAVRANLSTGSTQNNQSRPASAQSFDVDDMDDDDLPF